MSNWEQVKIKDVANTMSGGTPNRSTLEFYEHGDIPWLKTGELKSKFIHDTEEMITDLAVQKSSAKLVPENSVIVAMYGATVGNLSINKIPLTTNQACCSILPKEEKLNEEFLYYHLLKDKDILIKMAAGGAQPNISQQLIKEYQISLPPLKEQQKIVEILSSVDAAIEKTEQVIAKTEEVKKGLMQQLLTKGIGHTNFKQTEIGEIPIDWKVCMIKDVVREVSRPIKMIDTEYYSTITCKRRNGGIVLRDKQRGEDIKVKSQYLIKDNDFVISKRQIVHGACGVVPVELDGSIVSNEYTVLNFKDNMNNYYFNYICQMPKMYKNFYLASVGVHIEKMLFRTNDWYKMKLSVPPLEEQLKIVNILDSLNDRIECENKKVNNLQLIKQGLMQQLLTGKTRVKID